MVIYIASSWKNQHVVEMLTTEFRKMGHEVVSWVENNYEEKHGPKVVMDFEKWVESENGEKSFEFDTSGAMGCHLLVYVGVSGKDAAAECGMAFASGAEMVALWAKGEDFGLMRRMFDQWFDRVVDLLEFVRNHKHK